MAIRIRNTAMKTAIRTYNAHPIKTGHLSTIINRSNYRSHHVHGTERKAAHTSLPKELAEMIISPIASRTRSIITIVGDLGNLEDHLEDHLEDQLKDHLGETQGETQRDT